MSLTQSHSAEVSRGDRFEFGKNWARFLKTLSAQRIALAEQSLKDQLKLDRLDGLTFIDIGSGSGLFSLVARRLGATVFSFDYDPNSVACTRELKRRYYENDNSWTVEHGSALDQEYLSKLGQFDIVYSWGVLHHTGQMWQALENVKPLSKEGGKLFIAIYNDLGKITDDWAAVKTKYNSLSGPTAFLYALRIIAREEKPGVKAAVKSGDFAEYAKQWSEYDKISTRGMSKWHDWIDWIGGHPYERATVEEIVEFYSRDGFKITSLVDRSSGYGCNEFVFDRTGAAGEFIENSIPGGTSMGYKVGRRVMAPFTRTAEGWEGRVSEVPPISPGCRLHVIRDGVIAGPAVQVAEDRIQIQEVLDDEAVGRLGEGVVHVVAAHRRRLEPPFQHVRGLMWQAGLGDLEVLADSEVDARFSPVYLFDNGRQFREPHSFHDDIAGKGAGRFSHWGGSVYFATADGSDPNTNGHIYEVLSPPPRLPKHLSAAQSFGNLIIGQPQRDEGGWYVHDPALEVGAQRVVFHNDHFFDVEEVKTGGRIRVAAPDQTAEAVAAMEIRLANSRCRVLECPFLHERERLYRVHVPELESFAENKGAPSPCYLFEGCSQLPFPHSVHDAIADVGMGRFSHWDECFWFSSIDGSDPNENGRIYRLIYPAE